MVFGQMRPPIIRESAILRIRENAELPRLTIVTYVRPYSGVVSFLTVLRMIDHRHTQRFSVSLATIYDDSSAS